MDVIQIETAAGPDHGVQDGHELAHGRDQGHFGQFAGGDEARIEGMDCWVVSSRGERGHVQRSPHLEAPTRLRPREEPESLA